VLSTNHYFSSFLEGVRLAYWDFEIKLSSNYHAVNLEEMMSRR